MRTQHFFQAARWMALACLTVMLVSTMTLAFQKVLQPDYSIPVDFTIKIQAKNKKPIKTARTFDNTVVQIRDVIDDPTSIFLKGIGEGTALVELVSVDPDAPVEQLSIYVLRQQSPVTNVKNLQISTLDLDNLKKLITNAFPKNKLEITPITTDSIYIQGEVSSPDEMSVILRFASKIVDPKYMEKGAAGEGPVYDLEINGKKVVTVSAKVINGLKFTATADAPEQQPTPPVPAFNLQSLNDLIRKVSPDSKIEVIPANRNSVVVSGFVSKAEDVNTIINLVTNVVDPTFFNNQGNMNPAPGISGVGQPQINQASVQNTQTVSPRIINAIRVAGSQQVQLDVVVAQVSRSEFRQLGFNFLASRNSSFIGSTLGGLASAPNALNATSASATGSSLAANGLINSITNANVPFGVINSNSGFLGFLQALRTENCSKLLAEPKLVTSSGKEATFLVGGRQAVLSGASGVNGPGAAFEEVGTDLRFLPVVMGNGKIQLDVQPRVRSVNNSLGINTSFGFVPGFDDKRVSATVEMEAGQTLVIGGLIQNELRGATVKLPVLGDLPFLGVLFSTKEFTETEQEVVVLVTPHLVDPQSCDQVNKVLPGMETRSPDDFELFLEGILEAPRGPRKVVQNRRYIPAFRNGPALDAESGESRVPGYPLLPVKEKTATMEPNSLPSPMIIDSNEIPAKPVSNSSKVSTLEKVNPSSKVPSGSIPNFLNSQGREMPIQTLPDLNGVTSDNIQPSKPATGSNKTSTLFPTKKTQSAVK
ncbi:MAG: type II and III secretion system protein family protein [Gemmataceae bacterium]